MRLRWRRLCLRLHGGGDDLSGAVEIPPETTPAASSGGDMQNDNAAQNGGSSGNTAEYGLEIKGISKYAGLFVEDGTDETRVRRMRRNGAQQCGKNGAVCAFDRYHRRNGI